MARLPVPATSLNVAAPRNAGGIRQPSVAGGDPLGGVGRALDAQIDRHNEEAAQARFERERLETGRTLADQRVQWSQHLVEREAAAMPGAPNYTDLLLEDFDRQTADTLQAVPESQRNWYEAKLLALRGDLSSKAISFEAGARGVKRAADLSGIVESNANVVRSDPGQFPQLYGETAAQIRAADIPAEARAKIEAAAANDFAVAWAQGLTDEDPGAALAALEAGEVDSMLTGASKNALLRAARAEIDRREAEARRAAAEARATLRGSVRARLEDETAALRLTGKSVHGAELRRDIELAWADDPDTAAALIDGLDAERDFHNVFSAVAMATPAEIEEIRAAVEPEGEGFADEAARAQLIDKAIDARTRGLASDPAGYVAMASPAIAARLEAAGDDPAARSAAYRARMEAQASLGVRRPRVLAEAEAKAMAAEISAAPPAERATRIRQAMDGFGGSDGALWQAAYGELVGAGLDAGSHVLIAVAGDPRVEASVANALEIGRSDLRAGVEDAGDVLANVSDAAAPFAAAAMKGDPSGGRTGQINEILNVAGDLALLYRRQGLDATAAADKAVEDVLFAQVEVVGTAYVPRKLAGRPVAIDRVEAAMDAARSRAAIEGFAPVPFGSIDPALPESARREALIRRAAAAGEWVTEADGTGAVLMVPLAGGGALPLENAAGEPYRVDFMRASQAPATRGDSVGKITAP